MYWQMIRPEVGVWRFVLPGFPEGDNVCHMEATIAAAAPAATAAAN